MDVDVVFVSVYSSSEMPSIPGEPCTRCRRLNIQCTQQASSESSWSDNKNVNGSSVLSRGNNLVSGVGGGGAIACAGRLSKKRPSAADDTVGALLALRDGTASAAAFHPLNLPGNTPSAFPSFPSGHHPSAAASQHAMAMAGFGFPMGQANFFRSMGTNGVPPTPATPEQWLANVPRTQQEQFLRHLQQNQQLLHQHMQQQQQQQQFPNLPHSGQQTPHQQGEQEVPPPPPQPRTMPAPRFLMPPPKFPGIPGFGFGQPFMPYGSLPSSQLSLGNNSSQDRKNSPESGKEPAGSVLEQNKNSSSSHGDDNDNNSIDVTKTSTNSNTNGSNSTASTSEDAHSSSSNINSSSMSSNDSSSTSTSVANYDADSSEANTKRAKLDSNAPVSAGATSDTDTNASSAADDAATTKEEPEPKPEVAVPL